MNTQKRLRLLSKIYVGLSGVSLLSVSLMAFFSPQAVMDLVQVKLTNNDAFSSIRGVYGGVGLALFVSLLYLLRKNVQEALGFLSLFWGLYAVSRLVTIANEGTLGAFGNQWLGVESLFSLAAILLLWLNHRATKQTPVYTKI